MRRCMLPLKSNDCKSMLFILKIMMANAVFLNRFDSPVYSFNGLLFANYLTNIGDPGSV